MEQRGRRWIGVVGGVLALLAVPVDRVQAETVAVGLRAGSLGAGAEVGRRLAGDFRGRLGIFAWDEDLDYSAAGIDYTGSLDLAHLLGVVDYHPVGGAFRVSFGAVYNDSELRGRAPLTALLEDELDDLPPGFELPLGFELPEGLGTLHGVASGDELAPYVAIGFGHPAREDGGWAVSFDLGAYYQGDPSVDLTAELDEPINEVPRGEELVEVVLRREEAELEAEAEEGRFYPVLMLGVSYRF